MLSNLAAEPQALFSVRLQMFVPEEANCRLCSWQETPTHGTDLSGHG